MSTLPKGWAEAPFSEFVDVISLSGRKLKQSFYKERGEIPVIDQGQDFIGGYSDNQDLKILVKSPVIVFGDHTKVIKYVPFDFVAGADGIKVINPSKVFLPKLLYYFMQALNLPEKGYARHYQYLEKSIIPIPPLQEQDKIVSKVEVLFSFLNAGVASLRVVQAQLKRYRQAVLKAAFEGKLTEQRQKSKKEGDVSATELLEKLYEEKTPKERVIVSRFPDADLQLNDLPTGWVWTTLENLTAPGRPIRYGIIKPGPDTVGGVPYVRVKEMKTGQIDLATLRRCNKDHAKKFAAATLKAGDILISKDGTIGKVAIVPPELEGGNITQHVLRLSPSNLINRHFLARFIESPQCQRRIVKETRGVALQGINVDDFRKLPVPLPSLIEQTKIVKEIDLFSSNTDTVEQSVEIDFMLCKNMRIAILRTAFGGRLVPQDPADEPVEKLLGRIKAERSNNRLKNSQMELSQYVK